MEEERRWEEMDIDCLVNIFRWLELDDLSLAVPFVCKSWYRASLDPICWSVLNFRQLDFMPWSNFTKNFSHSYDLSTRFSFSGFLKFCVARSKGEATEIQFPLLFGASSIDLTYISNECLRLRKVVLPNLLSEDESHLPEIVGRWIELERLEMESKPSSFSDLIQKISLNCKNFTGLRMFGSFKTEDVSAIVTRLPKLKSLCLSNSYLKRDELLAIASGCKCLEQLIVRDCVGFEMDDDVAKWVSRIKIFEHEGSRLVDEFGYETDECDPLYVLAI